MRIRSRLAVGNIPFFDAFNTCINIGPSKNMGFSNHKNSRHSGKIHYPGISVVTDDKNAGELVTNISLTVPCISSNVMH
jgi:hypothetical protein